MHELAAFEHAPQQRSRAQSRAQGRSAWPHDALGGGRVCSGGGGRVVGLAMGLFLFLVAPRLSVTRVFLHVRVYVCMYVRVMFVYVCLSVCVCVRACV